MKHSVLRQLLPGLLLTFSLGPCGLFARGTPRRWQAQWIWAQVGTERPFQFVRFRKSFDLDAGTRKATAFVTADTFYRLWINGELAMHGPVDRAPGQGHR